MSSPTPSPVPSIANIPTIPDDTGPDPNTIDPTMSSRIGSMMYDQEENNYNLEWESRDNFIRWLTHEQAAIGIEIWLSRMCHSKNNLLYSTCETYCCAHNRTGGKKDYVKKTTCERKINGKQIEGRGPCSIQIKTYPHTDTILG